jgi:hypothetical protein
MGASETLCVGLSPATSIKPVINGACCLSQTYYNLFTLFNLITCVDLFKGLRTEMICSPFLQNLLTPEMKEAPSWRIVCMGLASPDETLVYYWNQEYFNANAQCLL